MVVYKHVHHGAQGFAAVYNLYTLVHLAVIRSKMPPLFLSVVWSYDPDSQFSMSALCRLENKGIGVLTSLETQHMDLAEVVNIEIAEKACGYSSPRNSVEFIVRQWTLGDDPTLPPTWRSLYKVLRKLGLVELSQKIEKFLSSEFSLITHGCMKN